MSNRGILSTTLFWHDSRGGEIEVRARVVYTYYKGFRGDMTDPPEAASVEIQSIMAEPPGIDIPDHFYADEELQGECLEDWAASEEYVAEWRAQCRRDDLLMGDDR